MKVIGAFAAPAARAVRSFNWNVWFWGVFLLAVAAGFTGSSLGWYRQLPGSPAVIELVGERKLFGVYRGIRGDEFIAHGTPNALRQFFHDPPFPRLNLRAGLAGRNDLVLHDTGAPVRHFSMIARPATWGFFLFSLRQALAWYWLFPLFFGWWSVIFLFNTLFPEQRRVNFLLATAVVFSPYCAAWSFWPVNNIGGLCAAAAALLRLPAAGSRLRQCGWGLFAGWGGAVSALTIYFPRLWPAAVLLGAVVIARSSVRSQRYLLTNPRCWLAAGLGGVLFLVIVGGWYSAAAEAVEAVSRLVYPGQRRISGGVMSWWELMIGWLAPFTICKIDFRNQSEMQAALSLLFPLAVFIAAGFRILKRQALFWALAGVCGFILWYQHIGFPDWLAAITLFDRCNPPRCGVALTLAQFLMIGLIYSLRENWRRPGAGALAAILLWSLAVPALLFLTAPAELWQGLRVWFPPAVIIIGGVVTAAVYGACVILLFCKTGWFIVLFSAFNIMLGAVFNPVCIAPERIENDLSRRLAAAENLHDQGRVLFATGNDFLAVAHLLSGGRALNGYFMYQDRKLFDLFFAGRPDAGSFWRMNHLDAEITPPESPLFTAEIPFLDRIVLRFNGAAYDFSQLPVDVLAVPEAAGAFLDRNPTLSFWYGRDGLRFYRVKPPASGRR